MCFRCFSYLGSVGRTTCRSFGRNTALGKVGRRSMDVHGSCLMLEGDGDFDVWMLGRRSWRCPPRKLSSVKWPLIFPRMCQALPPSIASCSLLPPSGRCLFGATDMGEVEVGAPRRGDVSLDESVSRWLSIDPAQDEIREDELMKGGRPGLIRMNLWSPTSR